VKRLLTGLALAAVLVIPQAQAGMISLQQASERDRVMTLVQRPEIAQQLEKMGIAPKEAKARVAAMSEEEVASLAGRLDSLPAGGELGNQDFLFIIVVLLLVALIL
jgi:hypothetical protein